MKTKQLFCRTGLTAYVTSHCLFKHPVVFWSMTSWASITIGDHRAQQFEQGMQQGGTYKCRGCGCTKHHAGRFCSCNTLWMVVLQRSAVYCSCREAGKTARCYNLQLLSRFLVAGEAVYGGRMDTSSSMDMKPQ